MANPTRDNVIASVENALQTLLSGKNTDSSDFTIATTSSSSAAATATNTKVSVGVASTSVRASNTSRKEITVVNDSANTIYLSLSGTAVINEGIRLNANGGSYTNTNYTGAVSAIATAAASNLTVVEV